MYAFWKSQVKPEIVIAAFNIATEQISKWSVVQLPRYSLKCTWHTRNYISYKCHFDVAVGCSEANCYGCIMLTFVVHNQCFYSHLSVCRHFCVFTLSPYGPLLKGIVQHMVNLNYVSSFLITGYKKSWTDMSISDWLLRKSIALVLHCYVVPYTIQWWI